MIRTLQIATLLMLALSFEIAGQPVRAERQDNLQQQKMAFFNEKLELTQSESVKFWPIYNDYQNRRDRITRDRNTLMQYYEANRNNMSDKEASELIAKYINFQQEETILLAAYTNKFKEILPAGKVMQIFLVELDFKKWLLEHLRQNKVQPGARN
jgi:hypothetical protein